MGSHPERSSGLQRGMGAPLRDAEIKNSKTKGLSPGGDSLEPWCGLRGPVDRRPWKAGCGGKGAGDEVAHGTH